MMTAKHRMFSERAKLAQQERAMRTDEARADLPWFMQRNLGAVLARWLRLRRAR